MKIKNPTYKHDLLDKLLAAIKKRRFVLLALFVTYNLLLGGLLVSLFYSEVSPARRQRMIDRFTAYLPFGAAAAQEEDPLKDLPAVPEELQLTFASDGLEQLAAVRQRALAKGILDGDEANRVEVSVVSQGQTYPATAGLAGYAPEFWEDQDQWALEVTAQDDRQILGMRHFALYPPATQGYLDEWLVHRLLAYNGLHALQRDLVSVDAGQGGSRIYALSEMIGDRFDNSRELDGPILNLFELLNGAAASDDPQVQNVLARFDEFRHKKRSVAEVFDLGQLATYFALAELLGNRGMTDLDQVQFYLNPQSSLLEPVIHGEAAIGSLGDTGFQGGGKQMIIDGVQPEDAADWSCKLWQHCLFADPAFFRAYVADVLRFSEGAYLQEFLNSDGRLFYQKQKILQRELPGFAPASLQQLQLNQEYMQRALRPVKQIHAYYNRPESNQEQLLLSVCNIYNLPVEVLGADIGDSIQLNVPGNSVLIQGNIKMSPVPVKDIVFSMPAGVAFADSMLSGIRVHYRTWGLERVLNEVVIPYALIDEELLENDLIRQKPNVGDFAFLEVDEVKREIRFKPGRHTLDRPLKVPAGYRLMAGPDTRVDLVTRANILSYSPLYLKGSEEAPVVFTSSDSTAQGVIVLNAGGESELQYVEFYNLSVPAQSGYSLTAAVSFYESPVKIDHCLFESNRIGDDYLNVIRTEFTVSNSVFSNTNSDAFDGDFCKGSFHNMRFFNSGNDAIDVSGSDISLENVEIVGVGDKGLSAGEDSRMEGRNITIREAEIAVTSKDLSSVHIKDVRIVDCRIAYTTFQKKSEFGPAGIFVDGKSELSGKIEIPYLIEHQCQMTLAGEPVKSSIDVEHVKQVLYGVKFGKASK